MLDASLYRSSKHPFESLRNIVASTRVSDDSYNFYHFNLVTISRLFDKYKETNVNDKLTFKDISTFCAFYSYISILNGFMKSVGIVVYLPQDIQLCLW